jgi:hypothetical protein
VPEVRRQRGIPELRRGATPSLPRVVSAPPAASATADVTLAADGSLAAVELREGQKPWSDALLAAVHTWRFAPGEADVTLSFRVEAVFASSGKVTLSLTGLRQVSGAAPVSGSSAQASATPAAPSAQAGAAAPSPAADEGTSVVQAASDVVSAPSPPPAPTPAPRPLGPGTSAVAGITLDQGVPDLLSGRRPVVPPLARIHDVSGTVVVGFSVDGAGRATVQEIEGPEALREQASPAVRSWTFRARLPAERLFLTATFAYAGDAASARVRPRD